MNRRADRILALVRALFLFLNRTIETILRRLKEAQDSVEDTVKGSLPKQAQVKFAIMKRAIAKGIDLAIVVLVSYVIWYPLGPFVGIFYSLFADGLNHWVFKGQSVGKKVVGLRVLRVAGGEPARWKDSVLRNLPVGVATIFAIIPIWGWIIFVLVGIPLAIIEVFLMFRLENETRLGDVMADTRVLDLADESRKKI